MKSRTQLFKGHIILSNGYIAIQQISHGKALQIIYWIRIYLMGSAYQLFNNSGQNCMELLCLHCDLLTKICLTLSNQFKIHLRPRLTWSCGTKQLSLPPKSSLIDLLFLIIVSPLLIRCMPSLDSYSCVKGTRFAYRIPS